MIDKNYAQIPREEPEEKVVIYDTGTDTARASTRMPSVPRLTSVIHKSRKGVI